MQPQGNKFITLLMPREQQAVDNINAVLNGDGSNPESGPGAWGDCGEVDVPVVLEALARLSRVPAPSPEGDRLPDAFTNAIGVLEHLGREGTAEHLQTVARRWLERLCQIPGLLGRVEGLPKSVAEIKADIERLQEQTQRNKAEQQTILAKFGTEASSEKRMLLAHQNGELNRLNKNYFLRIQALDWVLNGAPSEAPSERLVVYHWVDTTQTKPFQDYLDHYHDQQEEALAEASEEHYQEWLETCEPGDEYVVSENDHSLDPYEPDFEVVNVEVSEFGHMYQLTFDSTGAALRFGLGWGRVAQSKELLEFTLSVDKKEAEHFGSFLIREASHSTPTKDSDVGIIANSFEVRAEQPIDIFWLGANWQRYRSQGYRFNAKEEGAQSNG